LYDVIVVGSKFNSGRQFLNLLKGVIKMCF